MVSVFSWERERNTIINCRSCDSFRFSRAVVFRKDFLLNTFSNIEFQITMDRKGWKRMEVSSLRICVSFEQSYQENGKECW